MGKHSAPKKSKLVPVMGTALAISATTVVVPTVIASNSDTGLGPSSDLTLSENGAQRTAQSATMSSLTLPQVSPGSMAALAMERASQAAQPLAGPVDKNGAPLYDIEVPRPGTPPELPVIPKPTTPARFIDLDCKDFNTQAEAQAKLNETPGRDPHRLDQDRDGQACEVFFGKMVTPPPAPPEPQQPAISSCSPTLSNTRPHVARAGNLISSIIGFNGTILGRGERTTPGSDHPRGLALDFMTANRSEGDRIAEYALANKDKLNVTYVIWRQRINTGSGWEAMRDRGSITANHYDHVHISFEASGPSPC